MTKYMICSISKSNIEKNQSMITQRKNQFSHYQRLRNTQCIWFAVLVIWLQSNSFCESFQSHNCISHFLLCQPKKSKSYTHGIAARNSDSIDRQQSNGKMFPWDQLIGRISNKAKKEEKQPMMRAWMCHGRTHKEMVEKLMSVSCYDSYS